MLHQPACAVWVHPCAEPDWAMWWSAQCEVAGAERCAGGGGQHPEGRRGPSPAWRRQPDPAPEGVTFCPVKLSPVCTCPHVAPECALAWTRACMRVRLQARLADTNANLVGRALVVSADLARAMGPAWDRSARDMLKTAVECLADKKKPVGTCLLFRFCHKGNQSILFLRLPPTPMQNVIAVCAGARWRCHPHGGLGQRVGAGPRGPRTGGLPGHLQGRRGRGQGTPSCGSVTPNLTCSVAGPSASNSRASYLMRSA